MNCASGPTDQNKHLHDIADFVARSSGLKSIEFDAERLRVVQDVDGKSIEIRADTIEGVLARSDFDGAEFIQVNFIGGKKLLLTDALIGFKPLVPKGLDATRLPRVVTTPDVVNVFEAIQDSLHGNLSEPHELAILKKVFDAVLLGGEAIGFDLSVERSWMARIPNSVSRLSS